MQKRPESVVRGTFRVMGLRSARLYILASDGNRTLTRVAQFRQVQFGTDCALTRIKFRRDWFGKNNKPVTPSYPSMSRSAPRDKLAGRTGFPAFQRVTSYASRFRAKSIRDVGWSEFAV